MSNKNKSYIITAILYFLLLALSLFFVFYFEMNGFLIGIILVASAVLIIYNIYSSSSYDKSIDTVIQDSVSEGKDNYLDAAKVGIVVFDSKNEIKSMSDYFKKYNIYALNTNLFTWIPELQDLVNEEVSKKIININGYTFSVTKQNDKNVLYFKDVSKEHDLKKELEDSSYVVGIASFDNIDEDNDDEDYVTSISNIKASVFNYFRNFGICFKTLRNQTIYLVLNEKQLKSLVDDHFSILRLVKNSSNQENVFVTLSLAFAYGSRDFNELDDIASELLETARNRGGDQAIIKKVNEQEQYFGGYSETRGEKSKTRLRVIYNTIKNILSQHSKVFIVCHNEADSDCIGSAIGVAKLCAANNKEVSIVLKNVTIEPMIDDVLKLYDKEINSDYKIVTVNEALNSLDDKSLIIMVDHNDKNQSSGIDLLNKDKDVMIIDHHRRKNDLNVRSIFNYIESGASSCVEIVSELFDYAPNGFEVKKYEANIMYLGMLIDTNNFKNRVGTRTFEVAAALKEYGADTSACLNFINEPIEVVLDRSHIIENAKEYKNNIIISCMDTKKSYTRTVASQACDQLLSIRGIDASFVLVYDEDGNVIISARSNGNINVQLILEKMNGGGHLTAAGLQRNDANIKEVYDELISKIEEYFKEV